MYSYPLPLRLVAPWTIVRNTVIPWGELSFSTPFMWTWVVTLALIHPWPGKYEARWPNFQIRSYGEGLGVRTSTYHFGDHNSTYYSHCHRNVDFLRQNQHSSLDLISPFSFHAFTPSQQKCLEEFSTVLGSMSLFPILFSHPSVELLFPYSINLPIPWPLHRIGQCSQDSSDGSTTDCVNILKKLCTLKGRIWWNVNYIQTKRFFFLKIDL